jgi:hypothetical protein
MASQVVADHGLTVGELKIPYRDTAQKIAQPLPETVAGLGRDILRHEHCIVTQQGKVSVDVIGLNRRDLLFGHCEHFLAVAIQPRIPHRPNLLSIDQDNSIRFDCTSPEEPL